MATNYTGTPSATQTPSPAPGPRVLPIISIPAGTEVRTIESISQQMKVTADFTGHIQSAVGLDVPVVNATGTGFTAVTASGLGGTITPSGNAHISDGTRFVVQIQTGGAVGAATFKTSTDGGNTYGTLQTTAASMTDATSGITLAFSGTFTTSGTATFRSAFTPLATWANSAGNLRGIVDHSGYRRGQVSEYYEDWLSIGGPPLVGAANNTTGRLYWNIPASANFSCSTNGAGASPLGLIVSATNAANAAIARTYSSASVANLISTTSCVVEFEVALSSQTATDVKVGLSSATTIMTGTPSSAVNEVCLCKQSTDANWQLVTSNASSFTKTNTGVAPTALDKITIEWHGSASPYGASPIALMFINGAFVGSTTTTVPNTTALAFGVAATTTNATNSVTLVVSPVRVIYNRYANISGI